MVSVWTDTCGSSPRRVSVRFTDLYIFGVWRLWKSSVQLSALLQGLKVLSVISLEGLKLVSQAELPLFTQHCGDSSDCGRLLAVSFYYIVFSHLKTSAGTSDRGVK